MNIDTDLLTFPFKEEGWKDKLIVGGLLALFGMVLFPVYLPLTGYTIRVMRHTIREGVPSLPAWDDWGELFSDGLKLWVGAFVYFLPITIPIICIAIGSVALVPLATVAEEAPGLAAAGGILLYLLAFAVIGLISLLSIGLSLLLMVGQARLADTGELSSMFEFGSVWNLLRRGFKSFLIAYVVYFGISIALSVAIQIMMVTVILLCVFPFIMAALTYYIMVMQGALFGLAYREAQTSVAAASDVGDSAALDEPDEPEGAAE